MKTATITTTFLLTVIVLPFLAARHLPKAAILALDEAGILLGFVLSCLTATGVLVGLALSPKLRGVARRWLNRRAFANAGVRLARFEERVGAVVIPVSRREQPEWILRHLRPVRVALLCTRETRQVALHLANRFGETVVFDPSRETLERGDTVLDSPHDPDESRRTVRYLIEQHLAAGIPRHRIFVDTTGGTVPMSIGAFQAAEEAGVSSIYVVGQASHDDRHGLILDPKDPHEGQPQFMSDHTRNGG